MSSFSTDGASMNTLPSWGISSTFECCLLYFFCGCVSGAGAPKAASEVKNVSSHAASVYVTRWSNVCVIPSSSTTPYQSLDRTTGRYSAGSRERNPDSLTRSSS